MMHDAPINRAQSIEHLLKLMKAHPLAAGLNKLAKERDHALGVIAPAALAHGIAHFVPELARKNRLSVAVILNSAKASIGGHADPMRLVTAVLDGGQWYRMTPLMLGCSATVDLTVYGPTQLNQYASSIAKRLPGSPIAVQFRELGALESPGDDISNYDVVLVPHPGFDKDASILQSRALKLLATSKTPVIVVSSDQQCLMVELGYGWCYGYDTCDTIYRNPAHLNLMNGSGSGWGHSVGLIQGFSERTPDEVEPAVASLRAISIALGQRARFDSAGMGAAAPLDRVLLGDRGVTVLLAGVVLDEASGALLHYDRSKRAWVTAGMAEPSAIQTLNALRSEDGALQYIDAMAVAAMLMAPVSHGSAVAA